MPGYEVPPATPEQLHSTMRMHAIKVQIFPQPDRISVDEGQIILAEDAWQWNVLRGPDRAATGHSEPSASVAFDKAWAQALRLAQELLTPQLEVAELGLRIARGTTPAPVGRSLHGQFSRVNVSNPWAPSVAQLNAQLERRMSYNFHLGF